MEVRCSPGIFAAAARLDSVKPARRCGRVVVLTSHPGFDDDASSMDDTSFEPINVGKGKEKAWQVDWTCLSVADLERRQQSDAEAVAGILAVKVR